MNRSQNARDRLQPVDSALQHAGVQHAPRPLPLFLELVRRVSESDPDLARAALVGLRAYGDAQRDQQRALRPEIARIRGARLRDLGGSGPPAVLIPSLINPPLIFDLDPDVSLANAIAAMNRHVLLLDWGAAADRAELDIGGHIEQLLLPLLSTLNQPAAVIGYCLGGTMAIAAANLTACERVVTLAAPWYFERYPERSREALAAIWETSKPSAERLGALPMEVLQGAFWSLDPERTVGKFAEFGRLEAGSPKARRFVSLEDWANAGEPLPCPAAAELLEGLFARDLPGRGEWIVAGQRMTDRPSVPARHLLAGSDVIAPPETAPGGDIRTIAAGHVGMIVGSVRSALHAELADVLDTACRSSPRPLTSPGTHP